jgi:hypothetical protein
VDKPQEDDMGYQEDREMLRKVGFTEGEMSRLSTLSRNLAKEGKYLELVEYRRLQFVRWLVTTGKLTEQLVQAKECSMLTEPGTDMHTTSCPKKLQKKALHRAKGAKHAIHHDRYTPQASRRSNDHRSPFRDTGCHWDQYWCGHDDRGIRQRPLF